MLAAIQMLLGQRRMPENDRKMSDMSYEEIVARSEELRPKLDAIVGEIFQLQCAAARLEGQCIPELMHLTEFIVVCAWQAFNDKGQRQGDVRLMLRDGSMPLYIARGMISSASEFIENSSWSECSHEEDSDGSSS